MTKRLTKRLLPLMLTSLFAVSGAYAQNTSSALNGRVVDAAGQPVGGASVQILHVPSGTISTVTTNAEGRYQAQGLRVGGPYRVVAESQGVTVSADDVYLRLAETTTINLVEETTEGQLDTITVTASALSETFSADNKGIGTNLSQRDLIALPQPDRSIQNVVRADPRIVVTDRDRGAFSAAGQNFRYNSITVDTVNAGDPFGLNDNGLPTLGSPISPDAIEEYNISTANYDVTSRRGVGASVNAVTKSGTNEFKGSAYYAYQNSEDMIGENAAGNDWTGYSSKYTAGATFGGPIVEDTLFFFLSYEESSQKAPGAVWGPEGSGATNIVQGLTQTMVDQVIAAAAAYGLDAGDTSASNVDLESKRGLVKIDWNINAAHRASFRASRTEETQPVIVVGNTSRLNLSSNWYLFDKENTSYALSLYDDWTDTFSTEASIGYNKFAQTRGPLVGGYQPQVTVRMGGESGVPSVVLGTEFSSQANVLGVETWNAYFAGNWFLGDHTIKAGFDYQKDDYYNLFLQGYNGSYQFNSIQDFIDGRYRRYELRQPAAGYSLNNVAAVFDLKQWGFFLQDTWQASDRLSIQYGLRYDLPLLGTDPTYNPCFAADPGGLAPGQSVNLGSCGLRRNANNANPNAAFGGYGFSNQNTIDGNGVVQPRFGVNYALDTERMTQVRGGAGMFISNTPGVWLANPYSNNGVAVAQYDINRLRLDTDPLFSADPFNQNVPPSSTTPGLGSSRMGVDVVDKDFELPTVFKFTLGVDHELPWLGLVATAEYQKLDVYRGIWYQNLNLGAPTGTLPDGRLSYAQNPNGNPGSSNTVRYNQNPSFNNVIYLTNTKKGGSDSVTFSLKKPFQDNWSGMLGFTWTRATDVNPGTSSVANSSFLNRTWINPNDDYESTSNYDVPRRVIAQLTWSKALFGDYNTSISGFFDGHSGTPYSWTFGNDVNGDSYVNDLAYIPASIDDVAWAAAVTPQMQQQFIDYINNDQYLSDYRGKVFKRNKARAPWINQLDVSFRQEFPGFFKGNKAEFRLDIFNFTNLLNKDWGVETRADFPLRRNLADVRGVDAQGRYIYDISGSQYNQGGNYSPAALPVNESFNPSQRWSVMATVRYSF